MNNLIALLSLLGILSSGFVITKSIDGIDHQISVKQNRSLLTLNRVSPPETISSSMVQTMDYNFIRDEIDCMQKNIFFEARNQSEVAQIAVGWVTLNRAKHSRYPDLICQVVYQGVHKPNGYPYRHMCKFSWYCDGFTDEPNLHNSVERKAWERAGKLAEMLVTSCYHYIDTKCRPDPTHGATFYHNPYISSPEWAKTKTMTVQIDDHAFFAMY